MIRLGRDICGNLEVASRKEWLETNGLGGYASGTVAGMLTRGYHALLVSPQAAPLRRMILLSQLEETLMYGGQKYSLSTNHYRDTIAPRGYLNLEEFRLDPFPIFTYRLADLLVEKMIFMSYGHDLTWVVYRLLTPAAEEVQLSVRPLTAFRDLHLRKKERRFVNTHHDLEKHVIQILPGGPLPTLKLYHNAFAYEHAALWYQSLYYREEKERGLACEEDLFSPGVLNFRLSVEPGFLAATTGELTQPDYQAAANAEVIRRRALCEVVPARSSFNQALQLAADQFLVKRGNGLSVIAGYPWLGDSGRESMAALPGLTLATGRFADARLLLTTYAGHAQQGLLPNHFDEEHDTADYNTVDASLWFVLATYHYWRYTGDAGFIHEQLWAVLEDVVEYFIKGTRYHIRMDDDGLINLPEEAAQLTWMDAQVGDWIVTPRSGKPVEVNALWYNALCIMRDLAQEYKLSPAAERYARLAEKTLKGFRENFWSDQLGYLYDRIEDHFQDSALRPNQLLALSLPYPLIEGEMAEKTLAVVGRELYTTFGLRSLNRGNDHYQGSYSGDMLHREEAAYQGTVWPWLIGPYADALKKVRGETKAVRQELQQILKPFETHLQEAGVGTISEMFDGDPPHTARGCIARAWNVAEILRVLTDLERS